MNENSNLQQQKELEEVSYKWNLKKLLLLEKH